MPTFTKNNREELELLAQAIIESTPMHEPLKERRVRIDFLFAFPDYDERTGKAKNDALKKNGVRALGITRKISLKDRVKGHGDAEIVIDGDWWEKAPLTEQRALIDHELTHISVRDTNDDVGRPNILLRYHDYDFGWFRCVAERHGKHSLECKQAAKVVEDSGQYFWPDIARGPLSRTSALELEKASVLTHA